MSASPSWSWIQDDREGLSIGDGSDKTYHLTSRANWLAGKGGTGVSHLGITIRLHHIGIVARDEAQIEEIKRIWGIEGEMRGIPRCTV